MGQALRSGEETRQRYLVVRTCCRLGIEALELMQSFGRVPLLNNPNNVRREHDRELSVVGKKTWTEDLGDLRSGTSTSTTTLVAISMSNGYV